MKRSSTGLADLTSNKHPTFAGFLGRSKKRENCYRGPLGACLTQTCVRQSDLGATKHTQMVRYPLVLLNPTINTKFSCGKCEKLMAVQQLVPGTKTGSFTSYHQHSKMYEKMHLKLTRRTPKICQKTLRKVPQNLPESTKKPPKYTKKIGAKDCKGFQNVPQKSRHNTRNVPKNGPGGVSGIFQNFIHFFWPRGFWYILR